MDARETTVDSAEIAKFEAMSASFWDPKGDYAPLHRMNPCRLDYIVRQLGWEFGRDTERPLPFADLRVLDIGCGGGLVAEPLCRLGADVVGADASEGNIAMARQHAELSGLSIDYRATTAEALASEGNSFDVVLALEIIEHVADPAAFLSACASLLKPGGLTILSTLNRTAKSYALAIVGAEYILRWLPKGTHDWSRFVTPDELASALETAGLAPIDRMGMVPDLLTRQWRLSETDLSVNYLIAARKLA